MIFTVFHIFISKKEFIYMSFLLSIVLHFNQQLVDIIKRLLFFYKTCYVKISANDNLFMSG